MVQRTILLALAIVLIVLTAAMLVLWQRPHVRPPSVGLPEDNATEPYHAEMACIDRVLRDPNLKSGSVQPALDRCRAGNPEARRSPAK